MLALLCGFSYSKKFYYKLFKQKIIMSINQFDIKNKELLSGIQGNILKAHGRHHTANLFISGKDGKQKEVKKWLNSLVDGENAIIKSCYSQLRSNALWKEKEVDSGLFACIHISSRGYEYLIEPVDVRMNEFELTFKRGIQLAGLQDPDFNTWDAGINDNAHFLLILANAKPDELSRSTIDIQNEIKGFAEVMAIQMGDAMLNKEGAGIEHFGYVDGISQPLFFEDEIENYRVENNIPPTTLPKDFAFNPEANTDLVLIKDPFAKSKSAMGSFLVFRKLEQNVQGFKDAEEELAKKLKLKEEDAERAGAMLVGRFEDGTPVQLSGEAGLINSAVLNNFNYDFSDESKCPYHAHIRKTNPRDDLKKSSIGVDSKPFTMARRGITYGKRKPGLSDKPTKDVGLLFMSYQKSIERQFEVIQKVWANNEDFINRKDTDKIGLDLIIGQGKSRALGAYATDWDKPATQQFGFAKFVTMKGGGYFFAPSIEFLKNVK
jgi:Dyp-type peroxidase family